MREINTIIIREDNFRAELAPDQLVNVSAKKLKKLFAIMFDNPGMNDLSMITLIAWFPEESTKAKGQWVQARKEFASGWKLVDRKSMDSEARTQRKENRRLTSALQQSKKYYESIKKTTGHVPANSKHKEIQKCITTIL